MHRAWGVAGIVTALVVLTAVTAAATPAIVIADADADVGGWASLQSNVTDLDPDRVVIELEIRPDGSAHWQVRYRVRLDDQSTAEAFEAASDDIETNRLERAGRFKLRTEPVVAAAGNETGREMELQGVTVGTDRRQPPGASGEYGVVTYEFVWTNFAAVEDGRLRMGDALGEFFLTEDATMLVTWPDDYRMVDSAPTSEDDREGAVVWTGPREFTTDGPQVTVQRAGGSTIPVSVSPAWLAGAALLGVLLAAGWYRRQKPDEESTAPPATGSETETETGEPPEELLSDEERILRLLEDHGGRMKQQAVVETLEWSETKTSQVVGDLHDAGKIERYRLGRENVLALPGEMDV